MGIHSRVLPAFALTLGVALLFSSLVLAAPKGAPGLHFDGRELFQADCAACHGADAKGKVPASSLGFAFKMPDFTDCSFASREPDVDWLSSIHRGGRARAFPRAMPAWDQALNEEEMKAIVDYLRSFCTASGYPRGEFNLPLAMYTEKAFPEDEALVQTEIATHGPTNSKTTAVFEKRIGKRSQIEINLPYEAIDSGQGTKKGIGDVGVAWKQTVLADVDRGTIISLLGEAVLPTGSERKGLGDGVVSIETHALFAKLLPSNFFLQGDVFGAFPTGHHLPTTGEAHLAFGRTFAEDHGWGRSWSPQVEFLAAHDFTHGAGVDLDIVPQLQVSLSRRQHILFSSGVRLPINHSRERKPAFVAYLIWDWYDAGLFSGW